MFLVGAIVVAKSWFRRVQRFVSKGNFLLPGAAAAVLSVGMLQLGAWQPLERLAYTTLFQARNLGIVPKPSWDSRVAVIAIDEASLAKYGNFPWTRDRYTQLLEALSPPSPAAIGFDILFADPSPQDTQLAKAISRSGNVVLATAWDEKGSLIDTVPVLKTAASGKGQILHSPDGDGLSRQATLVVGPIPSLGLAMLEVAALGTEKEGGRRLVSPPTPGEQGGKSGVSPPAVGEPGYVAPPTAGELETEANLPQLIGSKAENVWINWPGKTEEAKTYSFVDVVESRIPKDAFKGKFVLVGITATASDPLRSPFNQNPPTAGVYLHAALIDNLLNDRLLHTPPQLWVILFLLALGPATSWLLSKQWLGRRIGIAWFLPSAWITLSLGSFIVGNWWLPVAAPVGTVIMAGIGVQLREQYEKQQLMSLFAKHVSPETADMIWQRKEEVLEDGQLQAQEMTATVLFADIRGFTSISEKLPPRELLSWLNQYLEAMSDCIMDHGGVIDKYIGDAIMAVFGVPFAHTEQEAIRQDALNAVSAAVAMQERLQELNRKLSAEGKPEIKIGIGIHTGPLVAGSVGGSRRLNYSVLGDTVNVAARLEPMNKQVQGDNPYNTIITRKTFAYTCDDYPARPVGEIQLRGREQATMIYCIQKPKSIPVRSKAMVASLNAPV